MTPSKPVMRSRATAVLAVVLLAGAGAWAQEARAPTAPEAREIFRTVMSPFCPGLTLADCPSPAAYELRDEIRARIDAGEAPEVILDELVAEYGQEILGNPSGTPLGRLAVAIPVAVALLAALGAAVFVRRAVRARRETPERTAVAPDVEARLDDELRNLD